jgi:hypothetical protein
VRPRGRERHTDVDTLGFELGLSALIAKVEAMTTPG